MTPSNKPYNLNFGRNVEPNIGRLTLEELREIQKRQEENEKKIDLDPVCDFMKNDKQQLQKVIVGTVTDIVKSKRKPGRPKKC